MDLNQKIIAALLAGFFLIALLRVFQAPLKVAVKLLANTLLGFLALWVVNLTSGITGLTLGAGFKGGEIVPTLFIGSTFGCAAAPLLGLEPSFGAAVGMIALFCGVVNCPLASIFLSIELFGGEGLLFFALACALAFLLSGRFSLYSSQKIVYSKLEARLNDQYQTEQEKERLSC